MTDRELLTLAARAAGIELDWDVPPKSLPWRMSGTKGADDYGPANAWNPLTDGDDALRLAVKLRLKVETGYMTVEVRYNIDDVDKFGLDDGGVTEIVRGDAFAATCRAIVRAAAEIGSGLP